jgi:hypothetical protein
MPEQSPPFSNPRTKLTIYKITVIYAAFYVIMKLFSIFKGSWLWPNLIICVPIIAIGFAAWWQLKQEKTSWWFVGLSIVVVSAVRYYEQDWVVWLNMNL